MSGELKMIFGLFFLSLCKKLLESTFFVEFGTFFFGQECVKA